MRAPGPLRALAAAALAAGAWGCAHGLPGLPGLPPRLPECPGTLPSTRALPEGDWLLRERVRIVGDAGGAGEGVDVGLEVVAEKRGPRLAVVAFLALGAKAFSLVQEGDALRSESHLGRALPVPPRNVLRDLYATGFGDGAAGERATVTRPECGYTATFVRVERRALGDRPGSVTPSAPSP